MVILIEIDTTGEIRYHQSMMGRVAASSYGLMLGRAYETAQYFDYLELEDVESILTLFGEYNHYTETIISFESEAYILVFATVDLRGSFLRAPTHNIMAFLVLRRESGMLTSPYRWFQGIDALFYDTKGVWHDEDRVARDIVLAHVYESITSRVNGGVPIFYGVGIGTPPQHISIAGYEPDNIVTFYHRGESYFFWYYLSAPQFGEVLSENFDVAESNIILAEIIELFDIQVVR